MNPLLIDVPETLTTDRLTLRVPTPGDGPRTNAAIAASHAALAEYMPWAITVPPVEESEAWVRKAHADFHARTQLQYHAYLRGTDTLVASVGFPRLNWDVPWFEIGSWAATAHTGQGYVTEAARALIAMAFTTLKAARVELQCDARNARSRRVAERLAFTLEGTLHHNARDPRGNLRDTHVFARFPDPAPVKDLSRHRIN